MNRFFMTMMIIFITSLGFSQYDFSGKVVDENNTPISGVVIRYGQQNGTVTNDGGEYMFSHNKESAKATFQFLGQVVEETLHANSYETVTMNSIDFNIAPVFVSEKYPITQTTLTKQKREAINLGQDLPILLDQLPSVVTTSDAGAGVGYTGIRVRGSDATRVNVTINGIPLNDSESQGVFWVNMPDFSSSTENITLVRGVGSSTNGAGAFGGSVHIATEEINNLAYAEYNGSVGSFNTWKNNIKFGTGVSNGWSVNGRLSKITSDGYVDRASSDLQGYFFQTQKEYGTTRKGAVKFVTFAGHEQTYQAWYGVRRDQMEEFGRTYNPYTYENQEDNYKQSHYQLLGEQELSDNSFLNVGLHYTKGKGFYEEFKEGERLADYGITAIKVGSETVTETDLVRRRWLDNDFYGLVASYAYDKNENSLVVGGAWNNYNGGHFGEVIQGQFIPQENIGQNYYDNNATKKDANIYAKYTRDIDTGNTIVRPYVDLQYRNVNYDFVGLALDGSGNIQNLPQNVKHNFFNPKVGVSADFGDVNVYASFARAQKEPNRNDYTDSPNTTLPKAEKLNDYEVGFNYTPNTALQASVNGYFMNYKDQLAVTGGINDVGEYSRVNVDDSHRLGVELLGNYKFGYKNNFNIGANATFSANKVKEFVENIDNYDAPYTPLQVVHKNTDLALSPSVVAGGNIGYTSPNNVFSTSLIGKYVGKQFLDNTSTDARSIDGYFVNNLTASINIGEFIPSVKKVQVNLLINNLLNTEYESNGYTFGYNYGGLAYENYYYPQAGINFLTGLTVRF